MHFMYVCTLNNQRQNNGKEIGMQKTLSRSGLAVSLRALAESGSLVDISVGDAAHERADVEIRQVGESMVFELPSGLTGYILDVAITNQTSRTIYCPDIDLELSWEDSLFNWLPNPMESGKTRSYRFPGSGLEFHRDLVINHTLLENGRLTPKRSVQGLLLATGWPMPESLRHGQWVDATLTLTASNHEEYASIVHLWTDRLEVKPKRAARKYNLFGEQVGHNIGSVVAPSDEPGAARDSEIVKPIPISARGAV
jgi:hypothetical protein